MITQHRTIVTVRVVSVTVRDVHLRAQVGTAVDVGQVAGYVVQPVSLSVRLQRYDSHEVIVPGEGDFYAVRL